MTKFRRERKKIREKVIHTTGVGTAIVCLSISGFSQLSGTTYSSFNDRETLTGKAEACEIFPGAIEYQFEQLIDEMEKLSRLLTPFFSYKQSDISYPAIPGNKPESLQELQQHSKKLTSRITTYEAKANDVRQSLKNRSADKQDVLGTLQRIGQLIQEIRTNASYHPDCLDIDKGTLPRELVTVLEAVPYLSEETKRSIMNLFALFPHPNRMTASGETGSLSRDVEQGVKTVLDDLTQTSGALTGKLNGWKEQKKNVDATIERKVKAEEEKRKQKEAEKQKGSGKEPEPVAEPKKEEQPAPAAPEKEKKQPAEPKPEKKEPAPEVEKDKAPVTPEKVPPTSEETEGTNDETEKSTEGS